MNEADTCRKYVVPLLQAADWDADPHSIADQRYFTNGCISHHGSVSETVAKFGGADRLRAVVNQLQSLQYA